MSNKDRYSIRTDSETAEGLRTAYEADRQYQLSCGVRPRSLNSFIIEVLRRGLIDLHSVSRDTQ